MQMAADNAVIIRWRTANRQPRLLFTDSATPDLTIHDPNLTTEHAITIRLIPAGYFTKWYHRRRRALRKFYFNTPPDDGHPLTSRFGCSGIAETAQQHLQQCGSISAFSGSIYELDPAPRRQRLTDRFRLPTKFLTFQIWRNRFLPRWEGETQTDHRSAAIFLFQPVQHSYDGQCGGVPSSTKIITRLITVQYIVRWFMASDRSAAAIATWLEGDLTNQRS